MVVEVVHVDYVSIVNVNANQKYPLLRFGPSLFFEKKISLLKLWGCGRDAREYGQPAALFPARRAARSRAAAHLDRSAPVKYIGRK